MRVKFYCICGAYAIGTIPTNDVQKFYEFWRNEEHVGPGHAECDAKTAAKARRRARREPIDYLGPGSGG